jgi:hypothetical protein
MEYYITTTDASTTQEVLERMASVHWRVVSHQVVESREAPAGVSMMKVTHYILWERDPDREGSE